MLAEELNLFQYSCNHLMDYTCHSRSEHDLCLRHLVPVHSARFSDANALHKGVWNGWSCSTDVTDQHEPEQQQKMKPQVLEEMNIHSWTLSFSLKEGFYASHSTSNHVEGKEEYCTSHSRLHQSTSSSPGSDMTSWKQTKSFQRDPSISNAI